MTSVDMPWLSIAMWLCMDDYMHPRDRGAKQGTNNLLTCIFKLHCTMVFILEIDLDILNSVKYILLSVEATEAPTSEG